MKCSALQQCPNRQTPRMDTFSRLNSFKFCQFAIIVSSSGDLVPLWLSTHILEAIFIVTVHKWAEKIMPNIAFHTCTVKVNTSQHSLLLLNIVANEHHLAQLQFSTTSFTLIYFFLSLLTSNFSLFLCQTSQKPHPT